MVNRDLFLRHIENLNIFTRCRSNEKIVVWQTIANPTFFAILDNGIGFYDGETLAPLIGNVSFSGTIVAWKPVLPTPSPQELRQNIRDPKILTVNNDLDCELLIRTIANYVSLSQKNAYDQTPCKLSKNLILYGPPGTGKTHRVVALAVEAIDPGFYAAHADNRERIKARFDELRQNRQIGFVTFHPGFAYEEFIEGITATTVNGQIAYSVKNGVFKRFCLHAAAHPLDRFVFIIDEINRGNVARIFGELITLIEENKRATAVDALSTQLPYSKDRFAVPANVWLMGTMNTADRSLTQLDTAMRRRFEFMAVHPDTSLLTGVEVDGIRIKALVDIMNARLSALLDEEHQLGVSYFLPLIDNPSFKRLSQIFEQNILPQLSEYFYNDLERVALVLNDAVKPDDAKFIVLKHVSSICETALPPGIPAFKASFNPAAIHNIEAYRAITEGMNHD